jgi:hypothetical protein
MEANPSLLSFHWFRTLVSVVGVVLVLHCYGLAQVANEEAGSSETSTGGAPDNYSSGKPDGNSAILKELEQMRQRIQELETRLQESHSSRESTESASAENNLASSASAANVSTKMVDSEAKKPTKAEPFAFADWTWLNGNPRTKSAAFDSTFFTPEVRADVDYVYDFNHPKDDTISGSSEVFRSSEVQITQLGVGGDFHYDNVRARVMTQFGMYSFTTPRNDASPSRGQWNLDGAYRYLSEAYGGYHFD